MSRNYFTAKNLTRKHKLSKANKKIICLLNRQLFLRAVFLNSVVYEVFSPIIFLSDFFKYPFIYFNLYIINTCLIELQVLCKI